MNGAFFLICAFRCQYVDCLYKKFEYLFALEYFLVHTVQQV